MIAWERDNAGTISIQARARVRTGKLRKVQTLARGSASEAQLGIDADGDAIVVWRRQVGTNARIQFSAGP